MPYLHLECQNHIKKSINVIFLHPCLPYVFLKSKPSECNFLINKINFIVLINTTVFMKKSKI